MLSPGTDPSELPFVPGFSVGLKAPRPDSGLAALEQAPGSLHVSHHRRSEPREHPARRRRLRACRAGLCRWPARRLIPLPWAGVAPVRSRLCRLTQRPGQWSVQVAPPECRGPFSSYPCPYLWARCRGGPSCRAPLVLPSTATQTRGGAHACLSTPDRTLPRPLAPSSAGKHLHATLRAVCCRPAVAHWDRAPWGVPAAPTSPRGEGAKLLPIVDGQAQWPPRRAPREVTSQEVRPAPPCLGSVPQPLPLGTGAPGAGPGSAPPPPRPASSREALLLPSAGLCSTQTSSGASAKASCSWGGE